MKPLGLILVCLIIIVLIGTPLSVWLSPSVRPCVIKIQAENEYGSSWQGTGVFINDDLILTAGHMVNDANKITVIWPCDYNLPALSWYQEDYSMTDLGFIYIETPEKEPIAKFADAIVGETVRALGNPFGYYPVLTEGIVSALNVEEDWLGEKNLLLTDCPINPGNSGCPLFNKNNEIVGITVAGFIYADGMNFIVPSKICELSLAKYRAIQALKEAE